jgi:KDO2-lipid IV(A) lauroyltransferase
MKPRYVAEYWGLLAVSALVRLLPRPAALWFGAVMGRIGWWTGLRRRLVLANLSQAFPELAPAARGLIARRSAANFGRTGVEFLRFAGRDRDRVSDLVAVDGLSLLRDALEPGCGALIVTSHLGSWALYVTALAAQGIPASLLVGRQHNPKVDALILGIPGDAVRFISKGPSSPRGVLKALRQGNAVVLVADQRSPHGPLVPFLGKEAHTLPLPGAILERHQVPLFVMAGHRVRGGRHQVELTPVELRDSSHPLPERGEQRRYTISKLINQHLGEAILRHPEQYFWYHDRWRRYRDQSPSAVAENYSPEIDAPEIDTPE